MFGLQSSARAGSRPEPPREVSTRRRRCRLGPAAAQALHVIGPTGPKPMATDHVTAKSVLTRRAGLICRSPSDELGDRTRTTDPKIRQWLTPLSPEAGEPPRPLPAASGQERSVAVYHGESRLAFPQVDRLLGSRMEWCPRADSNCRTRLRRPMLYPLSYGGGSCRLLGRKLRGPARLAGSCGAWSGARGLFRVLEQTDWCFGAFRGAPKPKVGLCWRQRGVATRRAGCGVAGGGGARGR